jgi:hypothetical protein
MLRSSGVPIVFGGGSLSGVAPHLRARLDCRPPVKDGDLVDLAGSGKRRPVLILDGLFSENRALSPTECREMLHNGWTILGASSMGALRAADLWSEGMIGVGDIYLGLRTGIVRGDGEVAVALNPFTFEEITVTIVFLRATAAALLSAGCTTEVDARKLVATAGRIHFLDRTAEACVAAWMAAGIGEEVRAAALAYLAVPRHNPKMRDAGSAVAHLLATLWPDQRAELDGVWRPGLLTGVVTCKACGERLALDALFCARCTSTAHEEQ